MTVSWYDNELRGSRHTRRRKVVVADRQVDRKPVAYSHDGAVFQPQLRGAGKSDRFPTTHDLNRFVEQRLWRFRWAADRRPYRVYGFLGYCLLVPRRVFVNGINAPGIPPQSAALSYEGLVRFDGHLKKYDSCSKTRYWGFYPTAV